MFKYILFVLFFITDVVHAQTVRTIGADYIDGNNSGFRNYAVNPYLDKNLAGVTCTSFATCALTTTEKLQSTQSLSLTATSASGTAKFRVKAFDRELYGQNCEFSIDVFTAATVAPHYDVYLENNGTQVGGTTTAMVLQTNQTKRYSVQAPCGTASSGPYDLVIDSNATTGTNIKVDNFYAGLNRNLGTIAQAQWIGAVKYVGATNCVWNTASATFANFVVDPDCNTATATGAVTAPGTKIPAIVIPSLAPGVYRFVAKGTFLNGTPGAVCSFRFSDGTNNTISNRVGVSSVAGNAQMPVIEGEIVYTTPQSNLTINIQTAESGASSCQVSAPVATLGDLEISVYYSPTQSQTAVRMDQSNYDWTAYTPTFTQMGTPTVELCRHKRDGSDLLLECRFTGGSAGASEIRMSIPGSLVASSARYVASVTNPVGYYFRGQTATDNHGGPIMIRPGDNYVTFGSSYTFGTTSVDPFNPLTSLAGAGVRHTVTARIAIEGWTENQNAPLLVGGVTSSSAGLERVERVAFGGTTEPSACTATPCTIYRQSGAVSSVSRNSAGQYNINFNSGVFSQAPVCTPNVRFIATGALWCVGRDGGTFSSTRYDLTCINSLIAATDGMADVTCVGPR
jgi:hypothetical protein